MHKINIMSPILDFVLEGLSKEYHASVQKNAVWQHEGLFIEATEDEEKDYRQWAREEYTPEQHINPTWHPVVVDECIKIIKEFIAD